MENIMKQSKESLVAACLEDFLTKLDRLFARYRDEGIFEGYSRIGLNRMVISEEAYKKDHGYMWSAIDGAIWMYTQEHPEVMITVDECVPDNGIVTFEFSVR